MKKVMVTAILVIVTGISQQIALTTNGVEVVLFNDSTWIPLEFGKKARDDSSWHHISRVAVTEDSNLVLLGQNNWEYLRAEDTVGTQYSDIDMSELPDLMPDEPPQLRHLPSPEYPLGVTVRGDEGVAMVKALVDTNGEIISVEILESSGYIELDQGAIKAARKARFKPAKHKGYPIRTYVSLPYTFRLTEKE